MTVNTRVVLFAATVVVSLSAAAVAVAVTSCTRGPSDALVALGNDPMASFTPAGAELTDTYESDSGSSLGIRHSATLRRTFTFPDGDASSALPGVAELAEREGWTVKSVTDSAVLANRDGGRSLAVVAEGPTLSVTLTG